MMQAMWSSTRARVSHRLAMHFSVETLRLTGDRPVVSFTFDDAPQSAATLGAGMLESCDAHGTFYIAGGLIDAPSPHWQMMRADDILALHRNGHEIGCHTFSHARACDLDAVAMRGEIERNRTYLQSLDPSISIRNFAYPFGYGSLQRKKQLQGAFHSCRSIVPTVNCGTIDLQFLHAMPLIDQRIDARQIDTAFDETLARNGWLIFFTHDVASPPSPYGCTPALLKHALEAARRRDIPILSVAEALQCLGA